MSCVKLLLWISPPIMASPKMQRKAGVYELSRNSPIYKFTSVTTESIGISVIRKEESLKGQGVILDKMFMNYD